jgi:hypothetical protein
MSTPESATIRTNDYFSRRNSSTNLWLTDDLHFVRALARQLDAANQQIEKLEAKCDGYEIAINNLKKTNLPSNPINGQCGQELLDDKRRYEWCKKHILFIGWNAGYSYDEMELSDSNIDSAIAEQQSTKE